MLAVDLGSDPDNLALRLAQTEGSFTCDRARIIDVEAPESSLLIRKLTDPDVCGASMPLSGAITESERNCIVQWVLSVAECLRDG